MIYTSKGAKIGMDGTYRYLLWRQWKRERPKERFLGDDERGRPCVDVARVLFVMLNPSVADSERDDPTIGRCVGFANLWGYAAMDVVNLFAYRAISPTKMQTSDDPVGEQNQQYVERAAADADMIVCAWGAQGGYLDQDETMLGWIDRQVEGGRTYCLAVTKGGFPQHPLYLPLSAEPIPYGGRVRSKQKQKVDL